MSAHFLQQVTVVMLARDEEANLRRTLPALAGFPRVVLVDSGSTDATLAIAAAHRNVEVVTRPFDSFAGQWNFGLTQCDTEWVLALDADYFVPPELAREMGELAPADATAAYRARFRYAVQGRLLSASLYPAAPVLFRRLRSHFVQEGHAQRIVVDGAVAELAHAIVHDDRKPLSRWLASQLTYARQEAELLAAAPWAELRAQDKLRRLVFVTPWLVPLYCLVVKRGALDGWPGLHYALQRGIAEAVLSLVLLERRLARAERP